MTDKLTELARMGQEWDILKPCECGGFVSLDQCLSLRTETNDGYKVSCQCGRSGPRKSTGDEAIAACETPLKILKALSKWEKK